MANSAPRNGGAVSSRDGEVLHHPGHERCETVWLIHLAGAATAIAAERACLRRLLHARDAFLPFGFLFSFSPFMYLSARPTTQPGEIHL